MRKILRRPRAATDEEAAYHLDTLSPPPFPPPATSVPYQEPHKPAEATEQVVRHPISVSKRPRPVRSGWYIARIVMRSFSIVFAVASIGVESYIYFTTPWYSRDEGSPAAIFTCLTGIVIWDTCEFITVCARRGYGITPKAHIGVDLILWMSAGVAAGMSLVQLGWTGYIGRGIYSSAGSDTPPMSALMAICCLIGILHFILWVRAIVDYRIEKKQLKPQIMYLPNGQPVVVLPRPYPTPPSNAVKQSALPAPAPAVIASSSASQHPPLQIDTSVDPDPSASSAKASDIPKRKPVPVRGTHYANPWQAPGPGYQLSGEERERAARGETQAQRMTLDGVEVAHVRRGDGPAEKFLTGGSGKVQRRNST